MKRSELRRKARMPRGKKQLARHAKLARARQRKAWRRQAEDFARIYGSDARVEWINALPCAGCGTTTRPRENAHTVTGGTGRKADAATIVPLCAGPQGCHRNYDHHRAPFDQEAARERLKGLASALEQAWQDHLNATRTAA